MICDLCSTPGRGTIVGPEQMKQAVFANGFDPFTLGLSTGTQLYRQRGAGAYEYWKTHIVAPDETNWNVCPKCWKHLKGYLDEPPRAGGLNEDWLMLVDEKTGVESRKKVEKKYKPHKKQGFLSRLFGK